jgi:hypothetical protein
MSPETYTHQVRTLSTSKDPLQPTTGSSTMRDVCEEESCIKMSERRSSSGLFTCTRDALRPPIYERSASNPSTSLSSEDPAARVANLEALIQEQAACLQISATRPLRPVPRSKGCSRPPKWATCASYRTHILGRYSIGRRSAAGNLPVNRPECRFVPSI